MNLAQFSTAARTRMAAKSVTATRYIVFKDLKHFQLPTLVFLVTFQVQKNKKDSTNAMKSKQFIAWWIEKAFSRNSDQPIVVLFDMTGCGLTNVVRASYL